MQPHRSLLDIPVGYMGRVKTLTCTGSMRRRLLDIGLIPGTNVTCIGRSPGGDPIAFLIRGAVIAIRKNDCANILIQ
jgi:ferrous iron transport protein A